MSEEQMSDVRGINLWHDDIVKTDGSWNGNIL